MTKSFSPEFDNSKNDLFWRSAPVVLIGGSRGDNDTVAETERLSVQGGGHRPPPSSR